MRTWLAISLTLALSTPAYAQRSNGVGVRVNGTTTSESVSTLNADTLVLDVTNQDTKLVRDAANVFGQRNGTSPQLHNVYNTYTSSTSYERVEIGPNAGSVGANTFGIMSNQGSGGGSARDLVLGAAGNAQLLFRLNGSTRWGINTSNHLITFSDNAYDVGAAGASRPRTGYWGTSLNVAAGSTYASTADKLANILDNAAATGLQINNGTPALGTCTGGTLVSGSHNFGGEVTGNTSGSCVINFGTPNFTNTPFCVLNDETTLTAIRISARSASSITVTGAVSADAFQYICIGRIGT